MNKQSDAHAVDIYYACKSVRDGMVCHRHTYGNGIYLPAAPTSAMSLTINSIMVVSNSQIQGVSDAFQNVVPPPIAASSSFKMIRRELASAKILNYS